VVARDFLESLLKLVKVTPLPVSWLSFELCDAQVPIVFSLLRQSLCPSLESLPKILGYEEKEMISETF
jgi:hypothetical protein